ncbi:MAG: DivIVA domain-containing protein [Cytophagales bacterium]|nr:DivIVA domain-containing protein [Cytophagales bacterium]
MKITPLDIRQKSFEKGFRGYDKDEVQAFLTSLSGEWERLLDENKELRIKLEQAEREVVKLREVEASLFKTLKTAEDTGANIVQQASKASEIQLQQTQLKTNELIQKARDKARGIIDEADMKAREISENLLEEVKELQSSYKKLENERDNLLFELKTLSQDVLDKVDRFSAVANRKTVFENSLKKAKTIYTSHQLPQEAEELLPTTPGQANADLGPEPNKVGSKSNSFFDELD